MNTRSKFLSGNPAHIFYSLSLALFLLLFGQLAPLQAQYYNFVNFTSGTLNPSVQENAGSVTLSVIRDSSDPLPAATITYRTERFGANQAISPDDYNGTTNDNGSLSGVLSFPATSSTRQTRSFTIPIVFDGIQEPNETFRVRLTQTTSGNLGFNSTSTVTINNVNPSATLSIDDVTMSEGDAFTTAFNFTVTLSDNLQSSASVDFATTDGTATIADNDYVMTSGTLNFAGTAGETQNITVFVNGDLKAEADETFFVNLSNSSNNNIIITKSTGQGTITNEDFNQPPTDITLSPSAVNENQSVGTNVGTLNTTDPDFGDTFTYSLVSGSGDADNASFSIAGDQLKTGAIFNFENKNSFSIRLRSSDGQLSTEKAFTITVNDLNEAPTNIALGSSDVDENAAVGTNVGTLTTTDPDAGNTFRYSLVSGSGSTDNASFSISGDQLITSAVFDFESKNSYAVRLRSSDGQLSTEKAFTITVNDRNEAPTDITLSSTNIDENKPAGTNVGTLSSTDPDAGNTFVYSLVSGSGDADNASFTVSGDQLNTSAIFDFESKNSYAVRLRSADAGGFFTEKAFTISINDVNETPTANAGSDQEVVLGQPVTLDGAGASDPDSDPGKQITTYDWDFGDTATGSGLTIDHTYAAAGSYIVILTVTDGGGLTDTDEMTVLVKAPAEATQDLIEDIAALSLDPELTETLTSKLEGAVESLTNGNPTAAVNKLNAFIHKVNAQRGKKLTEAQADALIAGAQSVIDAINFQPPSAAIPGGEGTLTNSGPESASTADIETTDAEETVNTKEIAGVEVADTLSQVTNSMLETGDETQSAIVVIPAAYTLQQNYPNPFNPSTTIRFALPEAAQVQLTIYDISGREVRRLLSGSRAAGSYDIQWDATGNNGAPLASGIYIYRLQAGSFIQTRKMTLLK